MRGSVSNPPLPGDFSVFSGPRLYPSRQPVGVRGKPRGMRIGSADAPAESDASMRARNLPGGRMGGGTCQTATNPG